MNSYTFTKSPVNVDHLTKDIVSSAIATVLDHINFNAPDALEVVFRATLSTDDETLLGTIVTAHDGTALPPVYIPREVVTQEEKNDKTLKLACSMATFDATTNIAVCEIQVPGTFVGFDYNDPGRFVAGGYAFTDAGKFGDKCTKIEVVDKDGILGAGNDYVVKTYHDQDVDPSVAGWYLWASPNGQQEIEIDPIGGYGKMPSGLYLRITFQRIAGSTATQVVTNIWWGKLE